MKLGVLVMSVLGRCSELDLLNILGQTVLPLSWLHHFDFGLCMCTYCCVILHLFATLINRGGYSQRLVKDYGR